MRNRYMLLISIILSTSRLMAQPTITHKNAIQPGDKFISHLVTSGINLQIGTGLNQNWWFSNLNPSSTSTYEYFDPANTPFAAQFPNANLVSFDGTTYGYVELTQSSWLDYGFISTVSNFGDYISTEDPGVPIIKFPLNYGDTSTEIFSNYTSYIDGTAFDSVVSLKTSNLTKEVIGAGNLTTPYESYQNVLLELHEDSYTTVNEWYNGGSITSTSSVSGTRQTYYWWSEDVNKKHPIAKYVLNADDGTPVSFIYNEIENWPNTIEENINLAVSIYPNPATNWLNVSNFENEKIMIQLYSINGKLLVNEFVENALDVSFLNQGIYIAKLIDKETNEIIKIKKITKN
ncbi:MAG: T9SS type A sorting domain-containing protein [Flavobacteriales bacterium]|nr:T9SS type A sorting domain-containing protein [Flavobacteriales bacterium]